MTNNCVIAGRRKTPPKQSGILARWLGAGLPRAFQSLAMTALLLAFAAPPARAACTGPEGVKGAIIYNDDENMAQYCDGDDWIAMAGRVEVKVSVPPGPSGCANIGDLCADMTIFAGWHPLTQDHLFIPPTDQEQPGSPGTYTMAWKNATDTNDINPDSTNDGQANHANRGGAIADFDAFETCENLGAGGHNDWYLPSQVELYYLWSVRGTIQAGGNITNFQNANYWSSTEDTTAIAWTQNFPLGNQNANTKSSNYRVRCVRR